MTSMLSGCVVALVVRGIERGEQCHRPARGCSFGAQGAADRQAQVSRERVHPAHRADLPKDLAHPAPLPPQGRLLRRGHGNLLNLGRRSLVSLHHGLVLACRSRSLESAHFIIVAGRCGPRRTWGRNGPLRPAGLLSRMSSGSLSTPALQRVEQRVESSVCDLDLLNSWKATNGELPCLEGCIARHLRAKPEQGSEGPGISRMATVSRSSPWGRMYRSSTPSTPRPTTRLCDQTRWCQPPPQPEPRHGRAAPPRPPRSPARRLR
jgi:hypothetical protein